MFRSSLIVAGAALLCSTALAQQQLDPARRLPVTVPLKNAGTLDVTTGKWTPPGAANKKAVQTVYNNTCTWTVTAYYAGFSECEDSYDEGRVPSKTSPGAPPTAANSQVITSFQIAYCTFNATPSGGMNMEIAFWDKLNGNCIGGVPVNHSNTSAGATWTTLATAYFDLSGAGLPGSTANGNQACWLVTLDTSNSGWTMLSDGDGIFDNLEAEDKFIWGKRINDKTPVASPNGFFLNGDPGFAAPGTCSYAIPCKTDVFTGTPCGTGLGAWDGSWINVDNLAAGVTGTGPAGCSQNVGPIGGTNCYFFGGYPTNVFDSYWLVLEGDTAGGGPGSFCTSKPSSLPSCVPTLTGAGTSVSKTSGTYAMTAAPVPGGGGKPGILIFTKNGLLGTPVTTAFGFLCLNQFQRAGAFPATPGGTNGVCNGTYTWPFQSVVATTGTITVGSTLHVQAWYRDSGFPPPGNANFTNGVGPISVTP